MKHPSAEDMLLIHELYSRYSWALDTGDTDAYVALYTDDAIVYENRPQERREAVGHDAVRELVMRFHGDPSFPGRQHRTTQIVIDPDPDGEPEHWQVRAYVLTTEFKNEGPPTLYWCGHTTDTVAKVDGEWLIARREIKPWAGDVLERFGAGAA